MPATQWKCGFCGTLRDDFGALCPGCHPEPATVDLRIDMSQGDEERPLDTLRRLAEPKTTGPLPLRRQGYNPETHEEVNGRIEAKAVPLRPKTSAERKAEPIYSGVLMYFPDALAAVSRLSKAGNDKHNPGEPLHWARGKSMDHMDCAIRHTLTPDEIDPENREPDLVATAWRILAQLQLSEEKRLAAAGIKPYSGIVPEPAVRYTEPKLRITD